MLKDILSDVLSHTQGLGFIDMAKIKGDTEETLIQAIDAGKNVVVYGKLSAPHPDLVGTIGLARMTVLKGYLNFPAFQDDKATITVNKKTRGDEEVPAEIQFKAPGGHNSTYRFMSAEAVEEQIRVPIYKGAKEDVTITPDDGNLKDLSYFANILGSYEPMFSARVEEGDLFLYIGSGGSDRARLPFAKNVSGNLTGKWNWPLSETLTILKLGMAAESCKMSFSEQGAMVIEMTTELADYQYVLPAKA